MVIGMITGTDITIMMTTVRIRTIMITTTTTTISDGGYGSLKKTAGLSRCFFYSSLSVIISASLLGLLELRRLKASTTLFGRQITAVGISLK